MLFCAFVDYSKAFDSVNRLNLWTKLLQFGITGQLFCVLQNIYKSIKSCVMINRFILICLLVLDKVRICLHYCLHCF